MALLALLMMKMEDTEVLGLEGSSEDPLYRKTAMD